VCLSVGEFARWEVIEISFMTATMTVGEMYDCPVRYSSRRFDTSHVISNSIHNPVFATVICDSG
jgi:hypothetical protein